MYCNKININKNKSIEYTVRQTSILSTREDVFNQPSIVSANSILFSMKMMGNPSGQVPRLRGKRDTRIGRRSTNQESGEIIKTTRRKERKKKKNNNY